MGVLPLQFPTGVSRTTLGLTGDETYRIEGLAGGVTPRISVTVTATRADGGETVFQVLVRVDSPLEAEQYRHGGILPLILRKMLRA
jgi:aconitate hydratase